VLRVPASAVRTENGRTVVDVQTSAGAEAREIRVGAKSDDWVHVVSGLAPGDEVIIKAE
jgi:multidrug efflux pump subunit AcrA (membrane-fusion protein)